MKNNIMHSRPEIVSLDYIKKYNGFWTANFPKEDDYVYYWIGDFNTGKEVRVSSLEILRDRVEQIEMEKYELEHRIAELENKYDIKKMD